MSSEHSPQRSKPRRYRERAKISEPRLAYTVDETAEQLSMSRRTVYNLIATGQIATVKINKLRRIPHAELMRIVEQGVQ
jgi:excisionase family DNA binding protein